MLVQAYHFLFSSFPLKLRNALGKTYLIFPRPEGITVNLQNPQVGLLSWSLRNEEHLRGECSVQECKTAGIGQQAPATPGCFSRWWTRSRDSAKPNQEDRVKCLLAGERRRWGYLLIRWTYH